MPPDKVPEISVEDLSKKLKSSDQFVVLDVREAWELDQARLTDARLEVRPMSRLAKEGQGGLPAAARLQDAEVFVLCHHGERSAQLTRWLAARGWKRVFSVSGGIDEYARKIDPSVGRY